MEKKIELVPLRQRKNSLNSLPKKGTKIGKKWRQFPLHGLHSQQGISHD